VLLEAVGAAGARSESAVSAGETPAEEERGEAGAAACFATDDEAAALGTIERRLEGVIRDMKIPWSGDRRCETDNIVIGPAFITSS
jgi:hypothetical protein